MRRDHPIAVGGDMPPPVQRKVDELLNEFGDIVESFSLQRELRKVDVRSLMQCTYVVLLGARTLFVVAQHHLGLPNATYLYRPQTELSKEEVLDIVESEFGLIEHFLIMFPASLLETSKEQRQGVLEKIASAHIEEEMKRNRTLSEQAVPPLPSGREEPRIHPRVWKHIEKIYDHYYSGDYKSILSSLSLRTSMDSFDKIRLVKFLSSLPLEDGLLVIKDVLEDEEIKRDKWPFSDPFDDELIWFRDDLIHLLRKNGIEYDEKKHQFMFVGGEPIKLVGARKEQPVLIDVTLNDFFYDHLRNEINDTYKFEFFTGTMVLSRKLIENLIIEVMRTRFPQDVPGNLELYFWSNKGRFHDFNTLLENLESKKDSFGVDKEIVTELMKLVKPFRDRANSNAHSIIIASNEKDVLKYRIRDMMRLLAKLRSNLRT